MAFSRAAAPSCFSILPSKPDLPMNIGCGYSLEDSVLAASLSRAVYVSQSLVILRTANSLTHGDKALFAFIEQCTECTATLILPDTLMVFCIGARRYQHHYDFHWLPFGAPILVLPDGRYMSHEVKQYIPHRTKSTWLGKVGWRPVIASPLAHGAQQGVLIATFPSGESRASARHCALDARTCRTVHPPCFNSRMAVGVQCSWWKAKQSNSHNNTNNNMNIR